MVIVSYLNGLFLIQGSVVSADTPLREAASYRSNTSSSRSNSLSHPYQVDRRSTMTKSNGKRKASENERRLQAQVTKLQKKLADKERLDAMKPIPYKKLDDEERENITRAVNEVVWPKYIIMPPPGKGKHDKIMALTYSQLTEDPGLELREWQAKYAEAVGSVFNLNRSYINGQIKTALLKRIEPKHWPSVDKIEACALRTIKLTPTNANDQDEVQECARNLAVFCLYWEVILAHACPANCKWWQQKDHRFTPISAEGNRITPQMEAYAVWTCENSWGYWQKWQELTRKYKNKQFLPKAEEDAFPASVAKKYTPGSSGVYQDEHKKGVVRYYGPDYAKLYTKTDAGSSIWGGITKDGKQRLLDLQRDIKAARKKPENEGIEAMVLAKIKENHGITTVNHVIEQRTRNRIDTGDDEVDWDLQNSSDEEEGEEQEQNHLQLAQNDGDDTEESEEGRV